MTRGFVVTRPAIERFLEKVQITDTCWLWIAGLDGDGYGRFHFDGHSRVAHRFAWKHYKGPLTAGLELDHLCHTNDPSCAGGSDCLHRRCVNPDHLELVTHEVNLTRGRGGFKLGNKGRPR